MKKPEKQTFLRKVQNVCLFALLLVCIAVFVTAATQLYAIWNDYRASDQIYENLIDLAVQTPPAPGTKVEITDDLIPTSAYPTTQINFEPLQEINPQVVAWIQFDSPEVINYPVLHSGDNETYLHSNIYGQYNSAGCLFVEGKNAADFSDDNTIIYGHNMKNSSMFGELSAYTDKAFYQQYPYFYIYMPGDTVKKYQVLSVAQILATDTWRYTCNFNDATVMQDYIQKITSNAAYQTDAPIPDNPQLVTLSTCASSNEYRLVVQGVYIPDEPDELVADGSTSE